MTILRCPALLVQYEITRDRHINDADGGWTCRAVPPPGSGWRIADGSSDRKTKWRRILLVDLDTLVFGGDRHG